MTILLPLKTCVNPRLRLVCVPHAGGWPSCFQTWRAHLPDDVELLVAQLPGRGALLYDAPLRSLPELIERLVIELTPYLTLPIGLYGHSFGSIICYELSKCLAAQQLISLNVSAMRAPHIVAQPPYVHQMDDQALLQNLKRMGGLSPELLANEQLCLYVFNTIRTDFEILETYHNIASQAIDIPINVFGATDDPAVSAEVLFSWHGYSQSKVTLHWMQGGHFYPYQSGNAKSILASILDEEIN